MEQGQSLGQGRVRGGERDWNGTEKGAGTGDR